MRFFIFLFSILLFYSPAGAQDSVKVYPHAKDYIENHPMMLPLLHLRCSGVYKCAKFRAKSEDKSMDIYIRKHCWAVEQHDSLFLNAGVLFKVTRKNRRVGHANENFHPRGFEYVRFRSSRYLYFRCGLANVMGVRRTDTRVQNASEIAGATGVIVLALAHSGDSVALGNEERLNYLYDIKKRKVVYLNRGVILQYLDTASATGDTEFASLLHDLMEEKPFDD